MRATRRSVSYVRGETEHESDSEIEEQSEFSYLLREWESNIVWCQRSESAGWYNAV